MLAPGKTQIFWSVKYRLALDFEMYVFYSRFDSFLSLYV